MGAVGAADIVAFQVNGATSKFISSAFYISFMLFGQEFSGKIHALVHDVEPLGVVSNMLLLNGYLHSLFNKGYVGFRPVRITKIRTPASEPYSWQEDEYRLYSSIHWLARTDAIRHGDILVDSDTMLSMTRTKNAAEADRCSDSYSSSSAPVCEADLFFITFLELDEAKNMFAALQLRWATTMIRWLSGRAGTLPDDG